MPPAKRKPPPEHDNPKGTAQRIKGAPHQTLEGIHESEDSDDGDDEEQEIVNVDFDFFDPKAEDFHGMKALLRSYLDDSSWDIAGFVDIIVTQTTVGTVIKTGEDESPIGFVTALNIGRHKDKASVQSIFQYLERNCNPISDTAQIKTIFEEGLPNTALLVSERLINAPEELAAPLYKGLFDEILWATEDEPTKELQDSFKFEQYLIISRFFKQTVKKKKKGQKRKIERENENTEGGDMIYTKLEDELLHQARKPATFINLEHNFTVKVFNEFSFTQLSDWSGIFPVKSEALAAHEVMCFHCKIVIHPYVIADLYRSFGLQIQGLKQFRLVMIVSAEKMDVFKSQFCNVEQ